MRAYKNNRHSGYALAHIKANNIKCRRYGWYAMVGKVDIVKIDGVVRRFHVDTHRELTREEAITA